MACHRWGTLVFSSKGYNEPWDGQRNNMSLPSGTYYYTLTSDVLVKSVTGSVSILR
ncbi:T9SS type B sorting domain-containing protein [Parapedobacter soli]|uniref:T9SS type B sorting domain-containing protein n=1 Tax=Parapedobacter soli TaxID=416955 RepID=UPI0036F2DFC8